MGEKRGGEKKNAGEKRKTDGPGGGKRGGFSGRKRKKEPGTGGEGFI